MVVILPCQGKSGNGYIWRGKAVADAKSENIGLLWTFGDIVKTDYYYYLNRTAVENKKKKTL